MTLSDLKSRSLLIGSVSIGILVIGIVLILILIPEPQDTRREAVSTTGTVKLRLDPATLQVSPGGAKQTVSVSMNSEGRQFNVIRMVMSYPAPATGEPPLIASNLRKSGLTTGEGWNCTFTEQPSVTGGLYRIVMQNCNYSPPSGARTTSTSSFTEVMKFDIEAAEGAAAQTIALRFQDNETKVEGPTSETGFGDIAAVTDSVVNITIAASDTPPTDPPADAKAVLSIAPTTLSMNAGETKPITLQLNTNQYSVNGFSTELYYQIPTSLLGPPATPQISFASPQLTGLPTTAGDWECAGVSQPEVVNANRYKMGISCFTRTTKHIKSSAPENILTLNLVADSGAIAQSLTIQLNPEETKVTTFIANSTVDVAAPPTASLALNVQAAAGASSPTPTPTPTPTSTPTPTPAASAGTAACNATCSVSRDCADGRSCVSGRCRDSRCTSDDTCRCETTNPGANDETLPESGFDQTAAFTLLGLIFLLGGSQLLMVYRGKIFNKIEE